MTYEWSLRPAVASDREFLFDPHEVLLGPRIEELFGPWDDTAQWDFFDRWFRPEDTSVITLGEKDLGVIALEYRDDEVYVTRLELVPGSQGRGIGAAVMRRVLREAADASRAVSLHVFESNPARSLCRRLGFVTVEEQNGRILMKPTPA